MTRTGSDQRKDQESGNAVVCLRVSLMFLTYLIQVSGKDPVYQTPVNPINHNPPQFKVNYHLHSRDRNRTKLQPVCRAGEHDCTAPGGAPGRGRVLGWGLPGPARVGSAGLEGKAEGHAGADPSPDDKPVSLPCPGLPEGWEASGRTGLPRETTAAAAGSLWTFCIKHMGHGAFQ